MKPSWEEIENYRTHDYIRRMVDDNWYFVEHTTWGAAVKLKAYFRRFCAAVFNYRSPTCPYCGSDLVAETHPWFSPYGTRFCFACKALFWKEDEHQGAKDERVKITDTADETISIPLVDFHALGEETDEYVGATGQ
jgi:hypothetical protein